MHLERINNQVVVPIKLPGYDLPVKGGDILPDPFGTVFCIAKRRSGKTNVVNHIIKNCITKDTCVLVFCSSVYNDKNWKKIREYLDSKGYNAEYFTSIYEDGKNQVLELLEELQQQERDKETQEPDAKSTTDLICEYFQKCNKPKEKIKKQKKKKWLAPDYLIIFDDISAELRSPPVVKLMKEARHYQIKIVCSSQYLYDIDKGSRSQIQTWLIFKGQPEDKLKAIYEIAEVHEPFETFWNAYKVATTVTKDNPCPFLYYDSTTGETRRCFNQKIVFE